MNEFNIEFTEHNLMEVLQRNRDLDTHKIVLINSEKDETVLSYRELYQRALNILHNLQAKGLKPGDELVLQHDDSLNFLTHFWACLLGGIIAVPLSVGKNYELRLKLFKVWKILKNPYLFTDEKVLATFTEFAAENNLETLWNAMRSKSVLLNETIQDNGPGNVYGASLKDIAFLQFSSGSTGDPKGVILTHENLLANTYASIECSKTTAMDSYLGWMPLTHDMGMIGFHLVPLVANIDQFNMPTSLFVRHPTLWLKKVNQHRATILSSPNFGYKYFLGNFKPEIARNWDLSQVRIIFNGAEPISVELCNRFLDQMAPYGLKRTAMYTVYGLAEASVAVSFPELGREFTVVKVDRRSLNIGEPVAEIAEDDPQNTIAFVHVGRPVTDCAVRLCNDRNEVLGEQMTGHIQIKGRNVTQGYYNNSQATREVTTPDGWIDTGDLGFLHHGSLVITGRAKDIIFINGLNYYPHDIERVAEKIEGIELGGIAACAVPNREQKDDIVLFVLFKKPVPEFVPLALQLKRYLSQQMGLEIKEIVPLKKIPKTTSGKIQRFKLSEDYRNGVYHDLVQALNELTAEPGAPMAEALSGNEIEKQLLEIYRRVFNNDQLGLHDNFTEYGGNSLLLTQIQECLEQLYPGRIQIADLYAYPTVAKLAELLQSDAGPVLTPVVLPGEYFGSPDEGNAVAALEFVFQEVLYEKIKMMAEREQVKPGDILLAMYVYLFAELTGHKEITVQTLFQNENRIVPLRIDFNEVKDFSGLFKLCGHFRNGRGRTAQYAIKDLNKVKLNKTEGLIIPFYHETGTHSLETTRQGIFDIQLTVYQEYYQISLICEYNRGRLNETRMEQFVNGYTRLMTMMVNQYHDQVAATAAAELDSTIGKPVKYV